MKADSCHFNLTSFTENIRTASRFSWMSAMKTDMSTKSHLTVAFILFLLCLQTLCPFSESVPLSLSTDREALLAFKSQIISSSSLNPLSSWNQSSSPCTWMGVVCSSRSSRVAALNLSGYGLEGSISPYIGNLSLLQSLQLQGNQLAGSLPDEIGNLVHLQVLNLSSNGLQGVIPPNVTKLKVLRVLDLTVNKITGRIPEKLDNLVNLQFLRLGSNLLFAAIPPSISNISTLVGLNLGTNSLSGTIPSDLSRLRNLKFIDFTINNLTGTVPPSIYNMSSLVQLALASNQLWGNLPYNVGDTLPNLLIFNFCFNKFTGMIPGSLHNLTNITVIRMAHNFLEGTVPPGLGNLPFLKMYNIGYNRIVSKGDNGLEFITYLTNSSSLHFLAFDGNQLEGVIPESIANLSKSLSILYMGGNKIHGNIPASIGQLTGLTLLNISGNTISGNIPPEIGNLQQLQMLGLAANQLSGTIPSRLGNLRKLNQVDLSRNQLTGEIPTTFKNFQSLLSMDLSNNKLNGSIAKDVVDLPSLTICFNLSHNNFSGPLPQEIGQLKSVVAIDFTSNRLSGDIPTSIRECKSLEVLLMAGNLFSGPIPNTLAEVKGLKTIDLSSNQLSGFIPSELESLQALQNLNLSFNDLEGTLPTGGIFRNLSGVEYEGNPKLCWQSLCKRSKHHGRLVEISVVVGLVATLAICVIVGSMLFMRKGNKGKIKEPTTDLLKTQHQHISYDEIRKATRNFTPENLIGGGGFGSVYRGYMTQGDAIAIKVLDVNILGSLKSFLAECEALRNIRHRNLVRLLTSCSIMDFQHAEFLALVYEYLSNGSLEDWIKGEKRKENGEGLNVMERLNVVIDVATALDYLHHDCEPIVIHCDLKPSNILLDQDMTAKVGDFGLARLLLERPNNQVSISSTHVLKGSIGYIAPEYGLGQRPTTAGDVYSFGVTLLELFTGKSPTDETLEGDMNLIKWVESAFPADMLRITDSELLLQQQRMEDGDGSREPKLEQDCLVKVIEIALNCVHSNPDDRISARDARLQLLRVREALISSDVLPSTKESL